LELKEKVLMVKVAVVEPAVTVATRGTEMFDRVVLSPTIIPPEGAEAVRVIVQALLALEPSVAGLHCREEIVVTAVRLILTLCEVPLYAAVTVPLWLAPNAPVLIGNDPVVAFAATVTVPGIVSPGNPVLLTLTTAPTAPAALDSVTVQLPLAFAPNVVGLHWREETTVAAAKEMVDVRDVPLYTAVTVAFWFVVTPRLVAVKFAEVDPDATVTDGGTIRLELLLDSDTATPPTGAAPFKLTVQAEDELPCKEAGLQDSDKI